MPNTNVHQIKHAIHLLQKLQRLPKTERAMILVYSARPLNWRGQHTKGSPQLIDKPLPLAWLMPDADGPRGLLGCLLAIDTTSRCSSQAGLGGQALCRRIHQRTCCLCNFTVSARLSSNITSSPGLLQRESSRLHLELWEGKMEALRQLGTEGEY